MVVVLRFPLIAKPLDVDGSVSVSSHAMSLVYHRDGLAVLRPRAVYVGDGTTLACGVAACRARAGGAAAGPKLIRSADV